MQQPSPDRHYLEARVEHERKLASSASHPAAKQAHSILASLYLERLVSVAQPPTAERVQA